MNDSKRMFDVIRSIVVFLVMIALFSTLNPFNVGLAVAIWQLERIAELLMKVDK